MSLAVDLQGIDKRFGAVCALDHASLQVGRGTVHALVGENGAGKTTLMRILYGSLPRDAGTVEVEGRPVRFSSSAEAIRTGIGMVSQHYGIISQLSCLDNLMLGAEPGAVISKRAAMQRADQLALQMGFRFDWMREASTLSPSGAQKLEILKLLWRNARIMVLDEPTAMLSPADSDALFASLRILVDQGATVILVTHRLPEVLEHCQEVTVLRGGANVARSAVRDTNGPQLAEWIIGHSPSAPPALPELPDTRDALQVDGLSVRGDRHEDAVKEVSLTVRVGEVLGIAGVDGSGQRELIQALLGLRRPLGGRILLRGRDLRRDDVRRRIKLGMRLIPEDRHGEGLLDDWSLAENAALGYQRLKPFARGSWIDLAGRRRMAATCAELFHTRHGGIDLPASSLSGGNQQRFVAGRALCLDTSLLLACQPARGLDIEASRNVYAGIRRACSDGAAALVVSFDLDELMENCDRVVAMRSGRIYEPPAEARRDRAVIGQLMVGAS